MTMMACLNTFLEFLQGSFFIARKLSSHAGQRVGQNIAMVQILHLRRTSQIKPKAMHKLYLVRLNCRRVRPDMKVERRTVWLDDVKRKLPFGLGQRLPCLADMISLLLCCELG